MFVSCPLLAFLFTSFAYAHPTTSPFTNPLTLFQSGTSTSSNQTFLSPSLNTTTQLQSSNSIRCFLDPFRALIPITLHTCTPELKFLQRLRNLPQKTVVQGRTCPLHFRYMNDECEITLGNVNADAQGRFAPADVVENALRILDYCAGVEGARFGGQTGMDEEGFWWQVKGVPAHDALGGS